MLILDEIEVIGYGLLVRKFVGCHIACNLVVEAVEYFSDGRGIEAHRITDLQI